MFRLPFSPKPVNRRVHKEKVSMYVLFVSVLCAFVVIVLIRIFETNKGEEVSTRSEYRSYETLSDRYVDAMNTVSKYDGGFEPYWMW